MSLIEVRTKIYPASGSEVKVDWAVCDFSEDVAGIPDQTVRTTLVETGVMFIPQEDPSIRVSHLLGDDVQGLSALHEELCMKNKVATCTDVEGIVLDSIQDQQLLEEFVATRVRMFGALCMMDPSNEQFAATLKLLRQRS